MKSSSLKYGLAFIIILLANGLPLFAQATATDLPFIDEELEYSVKFNGMTTANAKLQCSLADPSHITLTWKLKSKSIYKIFFHVNNLYRSQVNTDTWLPDWFYKSVKQKNIKQDIKTQYLRDQEIAKTDNGLQWPIIKECKDLLTMLYHMRLPEQETGDSLCYVIDLESHSWQISGRVTVSEDSPETTKIALLFTPALPVVERAWKTDLMTNRISREQTTLTIELGPGPMHVPQLILFDNGESSVEMRIKK